MKDLVNVQNLEIENTIENPSNLALLSDETSGNNRAFKLHILVTEPALGGPLKSQLDRLNYPFENVSLKAISVLDKEASTAEFIPIIKANLESNVQTIVVGQDNAAYKTCFDGLQFREKPFNASLLQPDLGSNLDQKIIELRRPWLQSFFLLGHQAHLTDLSCLKASENEGLRNIRLGRLRPEPGVVEPEIRSSDLFGISLNALKHSEAPDQASITSTGLAAEEACQYAYYSGRSERNQICSIFDFKASISESAHGINLLGTLIWYYMHGLNLRSAAYPPRTANMTKFTIDHSVNGEKLTFFKDETAQKWWLTSPFNGHSLTREMPLIACDYQDYKVAANEELLTSRLSSWFQLYENSAKLQDRL